MNFAGYKRLITCFKIFNTILTLHIYIYKNSPVAKNLNQDGVDTLLDIELEKKLLYYCILCTRFFYALKTEK